MATITANRTLRTLQASASNAAGGTTNSSSWSAGTAISGALRLKITNGATGPTVACNAVVQVSDDNATWNDHMILTPSTTANAVFHSGAIRLPEEGLYWRVQFTGNTGQAVTVEAYLHELTSYTST